MAAGHVRNTLHRETTHRQFRRRSVIEPVERRVAETGRLDRAQGVTLTRLLCQQPADGTADTVRTDLPAVVQLVQGRRLSLQGADQRTGEVLGLAFVATVEPSAACQDTVLSTPPMMQAQPL